MMFSLNSIFSFFVLQILFPWTTAFNKAPGIVTIKVGLPESSESCTESKCKYSSELCIGSGRSPRDRCSLVDLKNSSGYYTENQEFLIQQSITVSDIRSIFYLNANFTLHPNNYAPQILTFNDIIVQYTAFEGIHRTSLHSSNYISMAVEVDVQCQSDYYPPFQCVKQCVSVPDVSNCDNNGNINCIKGLVPIEPSGRCVKDICKSSGMKCQNNSTCINHLDSTKCECPRGFTGSVCEIWDPCRDHKCKNSGRCVKRPSKKDYTCQCSDNYYGQYCENIDDPCKEKKCPPKWICKRRQNEASCYTSVNTVSKANPTRLSSKSNMGRSLTTVNLVTTSQAFVLRLNNGEVKVKETVKLIHYPLQDFTTMFIIIVLLIVMISGFGVTFWMQRKKYFQKKSKLPDYPYYLPTPSIINMSKFKSSSDNIKRWHSMDDAVFNVWQQPRFDQFSTMYFNSGCNSYGRPESTNNTYGGNYRNPHPLLRTKVSTINKSNGFIEDMEDQLQDSKNTEETVGLQPLG